MGTSTKYMREMLNIANTCASNTSNASGSTGWGRQREIHRILIIDWGINGENWIDSSGHMKLIHSPEKFRPSFQWRHLSGWNMRSKASTAISGIKRSCCTLKSVWNHCRLGFWNQEQQKLKFFSQAPCLRNFAGWVWIMLNINIPCRPRPATGKLVCYSPHLTRHRMIPCRRAKKKDTI